MPITEVYVDPSINFDSGTGTLVDPYGDLEYAIREETFDLVNGTRLNIKAGAVETLVAPLNTSFADTSVSIAWPIGATGTPSVTLQGYTATAGDGGQGDISGGGLVSILLTGYGVF